MQVWWTGQTNALPKEVVERFEGKVMAIVGLEMDQVRRTLAGDVSVPITFAYVLSIACDLPVLSLQFPQMTDDLQVQPPPRRLN